MHMHTHSPCVMHALRAGRGAHCPSVFVCVAHLSLEMTALFIYFMALGGARPHCVGNTTQELAHCCCGGGSDGDCELTADGCTAVRLTAGGWRLRRTATARFAFAPRRCD